MASTLASLLALPISVGALVVFTPAIADAAEQATCRIHAVEASQEGDGSIPKDLEFLSDQLQAPEFARYKGFKLLDAKDFQLELGVVVDQKFKSGHNVKLSLLGKKDGKLDFHTELQRSGTSLINMDFSVKEGQIMLIPVRRGELMTIFAYQCKS
ncbi:hypothetical protein ACNOYE_35840 [Nannocystaceae bacterium ST9]